MLTEVQFVDAFEIKTRPALILFEDCRNVVVVRITSNTNISVVPITKSGGSIKDSVIKLN